MQGLAAAGTGEGDLVSPFSCSCVARQGEAVLFAQPSPLRSPDMVTLNGFVHGIFCSRPSLTLQLRPSPDKHGCLLLAILGKQHYTKLLMRLCSGPGLAGSLGTDTRTLGARQGCRGRAGGSPAFAGDALQPALRGWPSLPPDSFLCSSCCQGIVKRLQKPPRNEAQLNMSATTNSKALADRRSEPACEMHPGVSMAADVNTTQAGFFPLKC